jgi:hypothetical protein
MPVWRFVRSLEGLYMISRGLYVAILSIVFALAGALPSRDAAGANAAQQEVNEAELHKGCDLRVDQFEDDGAQRSCASVCFTALGIVSTKAEAYGAATQMGLFLALFVSLAIVAVGVLIVGRIAARSSWSTGKERGMQLAVTLVALLAGLGVAWGIHNASAWPHMQSLYQDLLVMKRAGKTGASNTGGNGMSCMDDHIKNRILADTNGAVATTQGGTTTGGSANTSPAVAGLANYTGIVRRFLPITESRRLQASEIDERWMDVTQTLQAADAIDPRQQGVASVIDSAKVFSVISKGVPFPTTPWLAMAIGIALGWVAGLLLYRFMPAGKNS